MNRYSEMALVEEVNLARPQVEAGMFMSRRIVRRRRMALVEAAGTSLLWLALCVEQVLALASRHGVPTAGSDHR